MVISKEEAQFIRENKAKILSILNKRLDEAIDVVLYEEDEKKREILRLWAKEMKEAILMIEGIGKIKEKKLGEKEFTGV